MLKHLWTAKKTKEHRRHQRYTTHYPVSVWGDGKMISAQMQDLSYTGALLQTRTELSEGALLTLTIRCEHGSGSASARVIRSSALGLSLQFVKPSDDFLAVLVEIIAAG